MENPIERWCGSSPLRKVHRKSRWCETESSISLAAEKYIIPMKF